ncbi:MAG: phenylalanine--tRNA ligase subunit beta [Synergistaceae bacterium]|jgi:phenylalanyl-tRNA synthetase beta chain|nr:phenylalanine--tRNA ligase subunit beta [Synergistaceae bacterium]
MIASWQLLNRLIDLPASLEEVAERLTLSGAEVESIIHPGERISGVVTARVLSLEKHPARNGLLIASLDTGKGKYVCVTAAVNVKVGDMVFYGAPGSTLPGAEPGEKIEMGVRDFDGVRSEGMMLSGGELDLPDVDLTVGVLELPSDVPLGADALTLYGLGDALLDISVTPNRGDLLSVLGVARELKGLFPDAALKPMPWDENLSGGDQWPVEFGFVALPDPDCLNYHLGLATGVKIGPSPLEVRVALAHLGMRPISNIVDVTNYVMLLLGQPLHAFDLNTLPEREITVRPANAGETIQTLDGKERQLTPKDMLITSGKGPKSEPVALAGVMGGEQTGIRDETQIVVLEGASFSPLRVGHTSRRLGITSEAAFRYSRGVDPALSAIGVDYALTLMREWGGASIGYKKISAFNVQPEPKPVILTKKKLQTYLLWSDMEEAAKILEGYGFRGGEARGTETRAFTPPTWRPDITIEEDLVEEIGRWRGYDAAPVRMPGAPRWRGDIGGPTSLALSLRTCAIARGYVEAVTYSFLPESFAEALHLPEDDPRAHPLSLENPISQDWMVMRTTLLPGLLNGLRASVASGWRGPVRLFEIGRTFLRDERGHREPDVLAALICNGTDPRTLWEETLDDFLSVKADVEALLQTRGCAVVFVQGREPFGHSGQTADVRIRGKKIGYLARLSPAVQREMDFSEPVYVFELDLSALEKAEKPVYTPASSYPATFRDISMLAPDRRTKDEAAADIHAAAGPSGGILENVTLFDVYDGKGVPEGYRSMAFSLRYRVRDRTLSDEEVDKIHNTIRHALTQKGYNMR